MRPVVLLITLLLATMAGFSQKDFVGQTKRYLINYFDTYYIAANTDEWMKLVGDDIIWYFTFDPSTGLSSKSAVHFKNKDLNIMYDLLREGGYTKVSNAEFSSGGDGLVSTYCVDGLICFLMVVDDDSHMCSCEASLKCAAFTE